MDETGTKALQILQKWNAKKTDRGTGYFRAVLKEKPDHVWAHAYLAYGTATLGDEAVALAESRAAMKLAPQNMDVVAWHGQVLDALGKKSDAIAAWRSVLQRDPANSIAVLKLWDFALNPGSPAKLDERKDIVEILAKSKAEDGVFWNSVGLMYRDVAKDYKRSLEAYLKAAELSPADQGIQNDTGLIYLYHGANIGVDPKLGLPYFLRCLALVKEEGQSPEMGYRDTLQNLSLYFSTVEKNPEKCLEYASERNDPEFLATLPKELAHPSAEASRAKARAPPPPPSPLT
jgi:tetratricopeptide (TPR) repeat protein